MIWSETPPPPPSLSGRDRNQSPHFPVSMSFWTTWFSVCFDRWRSVWNVQEWIVLTKRKFSSRLFDLSFISSSNFRWFHSKSCICQHHCRWFASLDGKIIRVCYYLVVMVVVEFFTKKWERCLLWRAGGGCSFNLASGGGDCDQWRCLWPVVGLSWLWHAAFPFEIN